LHGFESEAGRIGNPLENLKLFNESEKNPQVIMKDGNIYKNAL